MNDITLLFTEDELRAGVYTTRTDSTCSPALLSPAPSHTIEIQSNLIAIL